MPESFLGKIDEIADIESRSRSELIREALRSYITRSQVRKSGLADKNARLLEALLD
jgi:metal-responsive CopG/Arc/MetJ family transcriptional regulator